MWLRKSLVLLVCLAPIAGGPRLSAAEPASGLWVPGGTPNLLAAAGLSASRPRATAMLDLIRTVHGVRKGAEPAVDERRARLLAYLDSLEPQQELAGDEVPLPVPEAVWRSLLDRPRQPPMRLLHAILADRNASLLYFGLFSMDDETRLYFASALAVVKDIYASDRAGVVALHGRSFRVRGGRIETPGGPAATSLWEAVVGERVSRPDLFILNVLGKDGGRLALIYDTVAHMDAPGQAFVLGLRQPDPERRLSAFQAFYGSCARALRCWHPGDWPFLRGLYDPAELLLLTRVPPDGWPACLGWRRFWERAFDAGDLPADPDNELKNVEEGGPVDPAWLVETIVLPDLTARRSRAEAWLFAQRVFRDAPRTAMPDVLVAMRGHNNYRALADTLERLGITDPAVYVTAFRQAQRVTAIGDGRRAATALALYQGALVLIERSRLSRTVELGEAARLVTSLARVPLSGDGEFLGGVASWIDREFLPAISRAAPSPAGDPLPIEAHVLAALAGARAAETPDGEFEHEGTTYRLDVGAVELARLRAVRAVQAGASLDAVLAMARNIRALQLLREADRGLARVLLAVAYACSLGDPDGTALLAGDPSPLHDFGLRQPREGFRARRAWAIPSETHDDTGRWGVHGSLLALDIGLADLALRRISADAPPGPPTLSDNDRRAFVEAVVLANAFDYRDADMVLIAQATRRGRDRVTRLVSEPWLLGEAAAEAGLDELRRQAVAWALTHEPDRVSSFFSLGELLRLGRPPANTVEALDAWGTSGLSLDGRLCLHFPRSQPWTTLSGRRGKGLSATLAPDLVLLVAEALSDQRLPAALTRSVLAVATPHVVERLGLAFEDDWITMVNDLERIVRARMDDYLAAVVTSGPLVPIEKGEDRALLR